MSGGDVPRRLAASLLGLTADGLRPTDPAGASRFAPLLETFAVTQVCTQFGWSEHMIEASHYRTANGVEVDLVLETPDGRVAAVEVKSSSSPSPNAAAGLRHLRDRLGPLFRRWRRPDDRNAGPTDRRPHRRRARGRAVGRVRP